MNTPVSRRSLLTAATVTATATATTALGSAGLGREEAGVGSALSEPLAQRTSPNILILTVDDMAAETPGCFGGRSGVTPTLDRLAGEGVAFHQAHVPVAVCQPSRSALMTGLYPHRNGAEGFDSIRDDVPVLNDLLRPRDYLTGILGKVDHLTPTDRFRWDLSVDRDDLGLGRNPDLYAREASGFFSRARSRRRPFFLLANVHDPHRPFHDSQQECETYTEKQLATAAKPSKVFTSEHIDEGDVPGYLSDLADIRTELAQYLSSCRRADDTLAAVLAALDDSGLAGDTIVVVLSDNGMALPFAKANCYRQSTRTPLIVRWPGVTKGGHADTRHLVSTLDLFPTLCQAAGVTPPSDLDGTDLTPLLRGGGQDGRERTHTVFHESAATVRYEMRATLDERWCYIWNGWSNGRKEFRNECMQGLSWPAMEAAAANDSAIADRVDLFRYRVPEELYDLRDDPDCLSNLAGQQGRDGQDEQDEQDERERREEVQVALHQQRRATYAWMRRTQDPLRDRFRETILATADASA